MSFGSISFTQEASNKLSSMKARTGITPNILARIGFCLSLREPYPPDIENVDELTGGKNIERQVLTGAYDEFLLTLLRQADAAARDDEDTLVRYFKAHMHRGVFLLDKQLKSLSRLQFLLPQDVREQHTP